MLCYFRVLRNTIFLKMETGMQGKTRIHSNKTGAWMLNSETLAELEALEIFKQQRRRGKAFTRKELAYLRIQRQFRKLRIRQRDPEHLDWRIPATLLVLGFTILVIALLIGMAVGLYGN